MKRNIINRVADLMLSNDAEMQSLARNMFLENNPRDSEYLKQPQDKYHQSSTLTSYGGRNIGYNGTSSVTYGLGTLTLNEG